ncbi:MAG TPA: ABC transporter substrate-binding protein, partial [Verrucomicrobiae bacterium]|nr:ABC transporter substrate-binding protein [Verrucomicrobiae bacterium]
MKRVLYLILFVLFGFAATVERSIAQRIELKKIRLNVFRIDAATVAARVNGYFAAEGLDVDVTLTPNSTEQMRGLSQGKFEVVSTAFDNVLAWSGREGAEIIAVAQISDKTVLPVFVRPEIKTWSDLKGKKLAADAVDTAFALVLRRVLLANGLDMTKGDYELVALGATGARLESMLKGETFAGVLTSPFDVKAVAAGMRRIGDSKEVLPDYPNTIFAVNREWAQKNRDTLVAYLRGCLKGMSWVKDPANRDAAIKMVGEQLKLNPKQAEESVNELSTTGNLNLPGLQVVLDLRNQFGFKLNKGDKLPVYYDPAY